MGVRVLWFFHVGRSAMKVKEKGARIWLEDIVISTRKAEDQLDLIHETFVCLRDKLNMPKLEFCFAVLECLWYDLLSPWYKTHTQQ